MGDMQSVDYLPRLVESRVKAMFEVFPVVVVTGARQTGKSTLALRPELSADHRDPRSALPA